MTHFGLRDLQPPAGLSFKIRNHWRPHVIDSLFRQWNLTSPLEADTIEMAEYFWYFNHNKARRELGFAPSDPGDTLNDTVRYVRENFLGGR